MERIFSLGIFRHTRSMPMFDIRGDPYGILAAHPLAPLLSLHHLDYLEPIFPNQTQIDSAKSLMRAYRLDPSRILQQSFCYDLKRKWSVSIAWGYSIQIYTSLLTARFLERPLLTFKTWRSWNNGPFTFNTRPLSSDPCDQPVTYFLNEAVEVAKSGTVTTYKKFAAKQGNSCGRADYARATAVRRIRVSSLKMDQSIGERTCFVRLTESLLISSNVPHYGHFDIRGDPYGILAAHPLAPLLSLHHLDYLEPIFPNQTQIDSAKSLMRAYRLDPSRILQQSFCYDLKRKWSVSIAWGYSIQIYTSLLTARFLERPLLTFKTWRSWNNGPFTFNTRPLSSDPCDQPVTYFLNEAVEVAKSGTVTTYKKFAAKQGNSCGRADYARATAVRRIRVSSLKMDPEYWRKGRPPKMKDVPN
ncbi:hypothetical protein CJ030_MR3G014763 [Morella rubra]|uniref:Uncharacterized protein n=1 Tax=Morella rubra TaxID=262757 RepID=A0A6A1W117_9ROSI|nr:hypothetical protein CJ030_MR3G014763 [Morella rubra]